MAEPVRTAQASWRRTHTCGELRAAHVGSTVTLNGWVQARRNHGGIYFLDLRDRYGITQVVLDEKLSSSLKIGSEYVLSVRGEVSKRADSNVNKERDTGEIELVASHVEVLSPSRTPPFLVDADEEVSIENRLTYRYIDLRRPIMQRNLMHRARLISAMRRAFEAQGFLEVETPILTKATPEGARDYLVPSRVHPGEFYALPQSPQIFKQILMVAGLDKYFQVARCFRDEDLRADRQPEFTQLDMEMSFVEEEDVFAVWERVMVDTWRDAMGMELSLPFPRLRWEDAMERFGVDKPDMRFALELKDIAAWAGQSTFGVFTGALASGGRVMGIALPAAHALSRKDIGGLEEIAKGLGAQGLAYWKAAREGSSGSLARFVTDPASAETLMKLLGAKDGDTCLFAAGAASQVRKVLGELRNQLGKRFQLPDKTKQAFAWVTHFPLFEYDTDAGRWFSAHHPFTAPEDWTLG
ncbi:MAG: aspartate--tRNA ligase, partial [Planctomycetota bacterium]